jgi:hypothetical protein
MTHDDIIRMAHEANCLDNQHYGTIWTNRLEHFAALVAAATVAEFKPRPADDGGYELECVQCWSNAIDEIENMNEDKPMEMLDETELHKNNVKFQIKANAYNKMQKMQFELHHEYFKEHCDLLDEDGYPTLDALSLIENWHYSDPVNWFAFISEIWYMTDWGWNSFVVDHRWKKGVKVTEHHISTAGWSGNESIIKAMEKNEMLWWLTHAQTTRGGHYLFEVEMGANRD